MQIGPLGNPLRGLSSTRRCRRPRRGTAAAIVILMSLFAAALPAPVLAANPVVAPIVNQGVEIELTRWVQIPDSTLGRPRLNGTAVIGGRFFVIEDYDGAIWEIVTVDGSATAELFFNVKTAIAAATPRRLDNASLSHGGLRGVAFHPDFSQNGKFYTSVMESRPVDPNAGGYLSDAANPIGADSVLIEWTYDDDTGEVDPATYRQVFRVGMPVYAHPIQQIAFNPFATSGDTDYGLLYVAHGDGSVQSATAGGGLNNDALGKILRIDPLLDGVAPYRVPVDNPFIGDPTMLDEVWTLGHRNPHHLAFAESDDGVVLIAAEAGRDNIEEVNLIERGENYGWSDREGTFVHLNSGGLINGVDALPANDAVNGYVYPAAQVGHVGAVGAGFVGQAIAGGYVVANDSELSGQYFYSDFPVSGEVYHSSLNDLQGAVTQLDPAVPDRDHPDELTQATTGIVSFSFDHDGNSATPPLPKADMRDIVNDSPIYDGSGRTDVRFGQGPDGELYILNKHNGWVYLVTNSLALDRSCDGRPATVSGLLGTTGDDVIVGTELNDTIDGLGGNDTICGLGGNDTIDGGSGSDRLFGGFGNDRLIGGSGADTIEGGPGRDVVQGGSGNDIIDGGLSDDRLSGNGGHDLIRGGNGRDIINGHAGNDQLFGEGGGDVLAGGAGRDRLFGGIGNDRLIGGAGPDTIDGGSGRDVAQGGSGNDIIDGGLSDDRLSGNGGDDLVRGGNGRDIINGHAGNDQLFGEGGDDTIDGGGGPDSADGGAGTDTCASVTSANRCEK